MDRIRINQDMLNHFRPHERPFVQRISEQVNRVAERWIPLLTDFLDPRQWQIVQTVARTQGEVQAVSWGGYAGAERQRALLLPPFREAAEEDFALSFLRITPLGNGECLHHGDYLGALTGLGLKRVKLGDIACHKDGADCVVAGEIAAYIRLQLNQVGRLPVHVTEISREHFRPPLIQWVEKEFTVLSLRLDAVAAEGFGLSRSKVMEPLRSGKIQVNWQVITDPAMTIAEGDILSLRGKGRLRVLSLGPKTKKGRTVVRIGKYI